MYVAEVNYSTQRIIAQLRSESHKFEVNCTGLKWIAQAGRGGMSKSLSDSRACNPAHHCTSYITKLVLDIVMRIRMVRIIQRSTATTKMVLTIMIMLTMTKLIKSMKLTLISLPGVQLVAQKRCPIHEDLPILPLHIPLDIQVKSRWW